MKKTFPAAFAALALCATVGQASAADYSKTLWQFVGGKVAVKPVIDAKVMGEIVMRVYAGQLPLPAEGVFVMYMPKLSQAHWAVMVINPKVRTAELVGAQSLTFVKALPNPKKPADKLNLFLLGDGLFKGLYVAEGDVTDAKGKPSRVAMLLTPQMLDKDLNPQDLMK